MIAKIDGIIDKLLDQLGLVAYLDTQFEIAGTVKLLIEARVILVNGS